MLDATREFDSLHLQIEKYMSNIKNKHSQESSKINFAKIENQILKFWKEKDIRQKFFKRARTNSKDFYFYEGPPFATGSPHYGHALAGFIKDSVIRHRILRGYSVNVNAGWDCHGVPVEYEIQKLHKLSTKSDVESMGIKVFNDLCRSIVLRCVSEWDMSMKRIARWIDHENAYMTMDKSFMDNVWGVFEQLYRQGLIYNSLKVLPYSWGLETPISNFEAAENYKEISRDTVYIGVKTDIWNDDTKVAIWTTLPWTSITNLAIGIHPDYSYVRIQDKNNKKVVILKESISRLYKEDEFKILDEFKGDFLIGKNYHPIYDYFSSYKEKGAFKFIKANFVEKEVGTGAVSLAPSFGVEDMDACIESDIPIDLCPLDSKCCFTREVPELEGVNVNDSSPYLIKSLKEKGLLLKQENITHRFPFCPRSDTPIVYKASKTWFLKVTQIKQDLVANNKMINWNPDSIGTGRFHNWLFNAKDWAISRNRFWGTPIPVWQGDRGNIKVISSCKELEELSGQAISDLHRDTVDSIEFKIGDETFKRCPEVLDCWFESGSMPLCQFGDFNDNRNKEREPADFVSEGIDQTRGWFYTLNVISTGLYNKPAFKNVIVNGTVLAENGLKMSKRLKNYPNLLDVVEECCSDGLRLYMLKSPATKAEDIRFSVSGCEMAIKTILAPLWQVYKGFFLTYKDMFNYENSIDLDLDTKDKMDAWILSLLSDLIRKTKSNMNKYNISTAIYDCELFISKLTNWYIRLSREAFWNENAVTEKMNVLRFVLCEFSKIIAPFAPFMAESMYQGTKLISDIDSVHLSDYPEFDYTNKWYKDILREMECTQETISIGRNVRKSLGIRTRMPLKSATIISFDKNIEKTVENFKDLIAKELNVDKVIVTCDADKYVKYFAKPEYSILGPILGKNIRFAVKAISNLSNDILIDVLNGKEGLFVEESGIKVPLTLEHIDIRAEILNQKENIGGSKSIFIELDTEITEDLKIRGIARDIVNLISSERKISNFNYSDTIKADIFTDSKDVKLALEKHKEKIMEDAQCYELNILSDKVVNLKESIIEDSKIYLLIQ